MPSTTQTEQILDLARKGTLLSAADVRARGWSSQMLIKLHRDGKLERVTRGLYALPGMEPTSHRSLAEVCRRVPKGVVCLLSALQFHEIGSQLPHEVWISVPEGTQTPAVDYPPLRIVRLRGAAYADGIETSVEGCSVVRVYGIEKTVADCFKFRHKIGLDVALEALKDAWVQRKLSVDRLTHFAQINRVERVLQPYLEAVVA
ncbi:MAG: AbiEi antitoxin N-terminal domain-containing protein [Caldimonas sp.]